MGIPKPRLLRNRGERVVEVLQAVEHDLYADTHEDERRQTDYDAGTRWAQQLLQFVRKAIVQKNGQPDQQDSKNRGQRADDQLQVSFLVNVAALQVTSAIQNLPACHCHAQAASQLDRR